MILIIDSGSSKSDWALVDSNKIVDRIFTRGINPYFQDTEGISRLFLEDIFPMIECKSITDVYFYGAGCTNANQNEIVRSAISKHLAVAIDVNSDLLGAARSLCGHKEGIACILGTGSNSCFYDGSQIVNNISPLGYILGDEGSGAVLGKLFIGACLKNQMPNALKEQFLDQYRLSINQILDHVYKQAFPNHFLASLSPFLLDNINIPQIYSLVSKSFEEFFVRNVMQYDYKNQKIHFVGSIAFYYKEILSEVSHSLNIHLGKVEQSPMNGLVKYHSNK